MSALSRPVRRLLAIAILALALLAAWTVAVRPLAAKFVYYRQSIAQSHDLLAGYRRVGAARPSIERSLTDARGAQAAQSSFLKGASIEIVAAELQNTVKRIVTTGGGTLKSTQLRPHEDSEAWRRVAIRVDLAADVEALVRILHSLEAANPYLFVDNVSIRAPRAARRARRKTAAPARPAAGTRELRVRWDVYGYMRTDVK